MAAIWLVEDDPRLRTVTALVLAEDGHQVQSFGLANEIFAALRTGAPDMLIVDIGLPDGDGLKICQALRASPALAPIPVLVVTGSTQAEDRFRTFQVGADDFLPKPFDGFELLLRVRNRLKRARVSAPPPLAKLQVGDLQLDPESHVALVGERRIHLTASECLVLRYLMERPGKPVPTETLLMGALGYGKGLATPQVLRTHVRNLRVKLEEDPRSPRRLLNSPGVGYSLSEP